MPDVSDRTPQTSVAPFQVRGRFFTAIVLQMTRAPDAGFFAALDTMLAQTPHFFANAPFVLDLEHAAEIGPSFDFIGLARDLRNRKIMLIGVQNGTIGQNKAALHAGLITLPSGTNVLPDSRKRNGAAKEKEKEKEKETEAAQAQERRETGRPESLAEESRGAEAQSAEGQGADADAQGATMIVADPVRSGQRIFADRGDLVVVASVSPGAELIARGNIHVYGPLRGRALTGVNGDAAARIFCHSLEAELIAIAGLYRISDGIEPALRHRRVQAFLEDGRLRVEPLK
ncbi:MAG TPA: septum site-determining protein MinC [Stellaceae bacterium]|nr:septum site-determining protein MinC [Stellaceae bacterium]